MVFPTAMKFNSPLIQVTLSVLVVCFSTVHFHVDKKKTKYAPFPIGFLGIRVLRQKVLLLICSSEQLTNCDHTHTLQPKPAMIATDTGDLFLASLILLAYLTRWQLPHFL